VHRSQRLLNRVVHATLRWVDRAGEVVPGTVLADRFGSFGAGSCIDFPPATLLNVGSIHVGRDVLVGRQATLAAGYGVGDPNLTDRALVIGDGCVLGARTTITAHQHVELGASVFTGQGVFITDASHGYQDPHTPIGKQFGLHQPVVIGAGTWIGHGAVILPGTRIGRNVVVAAGAVVRGEIEDHAVVAGTPARVVRRLEPGIGWVGTTGDVRPLFGPGVDGQVAPEAG
jgi:carbonic anhydrase/acetyltransferase-like protein (isoleucine patch superfamily)